MRQTRTGAGLGLPCGGAAHLHRFEVVVPGVHAAAPTPHPSPLQIVPTVKALCSPLSPHHRSRFGVHCYAPAHCVSVSGDASTHPGCLRMPPAEGGACVRPERHPLPARVVRPPCGGCGRYRGFRRGRSRSPAPEIPGPDPRLDFGLRKKKGYARYLAHPCCPNYRYLRLRLCLSMVCNAVQFRYCVGVMQSK